MVKEILFKVNIMDNRQWTKPQINTFGTSGSDLEVIKLEFLLVMFIVFLLLFHVVSWVRCGT